MPYFGRKLERTTMKTVVVGTMLSMSMLAAMTVPGTARSNTEQRVRDFAEKQVYKQIIQRATGSALGTVAGGMVAKTAGGVIGGVMAPTKTVDQMTEMRQRDHAIQQNQRDHGSPYYRPSARQQDRIESN